MDLEIKDKLNMIINEIVNLEDEVKIISAKNKKYELEQENYIYEFDKNISEIKINCSNITTQIEKEKRLLKQEQLNKDDEVNKYNREIRELQNELLLFKSKFNIEDNNNNNLNNELDEIEKSKSNFLENHQILLNKVENTEKCIKQLKKQKEEVNSELVNLISQNETLEQFINNDLNINYLTDLTKNKYKLDFEIYIDDIVLLDNKQFLEVLLDHFPIHLPHIQIGNTNYKIILNIIKDSLVVVRNNLQLIGIQDFFILITTKLSNILLNNSNNEESSNNNEGEGDSNDEENNNNNSENNANITTIPKMGINELNIYLKYIIKFVANDTRIKKRMEYINKEYKKEKADLVFEKNNYQDEINIIKEKIEKLNVKSDTINKTAKTAKNVSVSKNKVTNMNKVTTKVTNTKTYYTPYAKKQEEENYKQNILKLEEQIDNITATKSNFIKEIDRTIDTYKFNISSLNEKMKKYEKEIEDLEYRKNNAKPILEKAKNNFKTEIFKRKQLIEDKQKLLKTYISELSSNEYDCYIDDKMKNSLGMYITNNTNIINNNINNPYHGNHGNVTKVIGKIMTGNNSEINSINTIYKDKLRIYKNYEEMELNRYTQELNNNNNNNYYDNNLYNEEQNYYNYSNTMPVKVNNVNGLGNALNKLKTFTSNPKQQINSTFNNNNNQFDNMNNYNIGNNNQQYSQQKKLPIKDLDLDTNRTNLKITNNTNNINNPNNLNLALNKTYQTPNLTHGKTNSTDIRDLQGLHDLRDTRDIPQNRHFKTISNIELKNVNQNHNLNHNPNSNTNPNTIQELSTYTEASKTVSKNQYMTNIDNSIYQLKKTSELLTNNKGFKQDFNFKNNNNNIRTINISNANNNSSNSLSKIDIKSLDKIKPLLEGSIVYKRSNLLLEKNYNDFNYFNSNNEPISPEELGFEKYFMYCNSSIDKIIFEKMDLPKRLTEVLIKKIEKTVVTKMTKEIINAHQKYRKYKKHNNNDKDLDKFLNDNNIEKRHTLVNMFLLYIELDTGIRIEIIIQNYEDYKHWVNGIGELIKPNDNSQRQYSKNNIEECN